jgi:serine/tyrosine/threonine adenylyltransferase
MKRATPIPTQPLHLLPRVSGFAALGEDYLSRVDPAPVTAPRLLHLNPDVCALLGLDPAAGADPAFLEVMAGNRRLDRADNIATFYAGHQFGVYVPQLGDGRAILLCTARGADGSPWELQLKGAGTTAYSRFGDGRAVLRSTLREYLCSEALHHLGIPTTRALCLVSTAEPVQRETMETAALLCRVAPSHVRFGHFEGYYYRGQPERLAPLADQVIDAHFPHLAQRPDRYVAWLTEIVERTAVLIAQWQTVGFCHGVMNTDNMSVLGLTLDYGPFGFMDGFDAGHVCNHSDEAGRYAYDQQPTVGLWNCSRLLQATLPLLNDDSEAAVETARGILDRYGAVYAQAVQARWRAKLGLCEARDGDPELVNRLLTLMHDSRADFTRSFRMLGGVRTDQDTLPPVREQMADAAAFDTWLDDYRQRLRAEQSDDDRRRRNMNAVNPKYVLRNWMLQAAIAQAQQGDNAEFETLFQLLQHPFDEQPAMRRYFAEPPAWARGIAVSCSS